MSHSPFVERTLPRFTPFAVLLLAFAIALFRLDAHSLYGDEFGSLAEAARPGANLNSLPYSVLLNGWMRGGDGDFWLRFPSVLAALVAVALAFAWARGVAGFDAASWCALLLATNPFLLLYSQQVRFYSLGLAGACILWRATTRLCRAPTIRSAARWVGASALAVLALFLNSLQVLVALIAFGILSPRPPARLKWLIGAGIVVAAALAIAVPAVRQAGFDAIAMLSNARARYDASRGVSPANFAKIPLSGYFFVFGELLYPLTGWLVIPGSLLFGAALLRGLWRARQDRAVIALAAASLLAPLILYLVLDPLATADLQGAAPRYLIFLLPMLCLLAAVGALPARARNFAGPADHRSRIVLAGMHWIPMLLAAGLLTVNIVSLLIFWSDNRALMEPLPDWRATAARLAPSITPETVVLVDGRSQNYAQRYFPRAWNVQTQSAAAWRDLPVPDAVQRIVFVANDFHAERRAQSTALLRQLEESFEVRDGWMDFPQFVFVMDRRLGTGSTRSISTPGGDVSLPPTLVGIEFSDLLLPVIASNGGGAVLLQSAWSLPPSQRSPQALALSGGMTARGIVLFSNVTGATGLNPGTPVATLRLADAQGRGQTFTLRAGMETSAWDAACQPGACAPAVVWRKKLALLGSEAYPEAWREFDAAVFRVRLALDQPLTPSVLEVQRLPSPGTLHLWALYLEP